MSRTKPPPLPESQEGHQTLFGPPGPNGEPDSIEVGRFSGGFDAAGDGIEAPPRPVGQRAAPPRVGPARPPGFKPAEVGGPTGEPPPKTKRRFFWTREERDQAGVSGPTPVIVGTTAFVDPRTDWDSGEGEVLAQRAVVSTALAAGAIYGAGWLIPWRFESLLTSASFTDANLSNVPVGRAIMGADWRVAALWASAFAVTFLVCWGLERLRVPPILSAPIVAALAFAAGFFGFDPMGLLLSIQPDTAISLAALNVPAQHAFLIGAVAVSWYAGRRPGPVSVLAALLMAGFVAILLEGTRTESWELLESATLEGLRRDPGTTRIGLLVFGEAQDELRLWTTARAALDGLLLLLPMWVARAARSIA